MALTKDGKPIFKKSKLVEMNTDFLKDLKKELESLYYASLPTRQRVWVLILEIEAQININNRKR